MFGLRMSIESIFRSNGDKRQMRLGFLGFYVMGSGFCAIE
jgi:hypothetical protein